MAISTFHLLVFLTVAVSLAPSVLAANYTVGDAAGWDTGVDYAAWAKDKTFFVNDVLIFNYPAGEHNVFKVNGTQFQNCTIPTDQTPLTTGADAIVLAKPGKKWYICGKEGHCASSQKLAITVMDMAPSSQPSGAMRAVVSTRFGFVVLVVGILGMLMMA